MGQTIRLQASDGYDLSAYEASPADKHRGGLVVIQEIFGVNEHMRRVTDGRADQPPTLKPSTAAAMPDWYACGALQTPLSAN